MQSLAWEIGKLGDDAPRLVRAAARRLEAEPVTTPPAAAASSDAIIAAGKWIAGAVVLGAALIGGAIAFF